MTKRIIRLLSLVTFLSIYLLPSQVQANDVPAALKPIIIGEQTSIYSKVLNEERQLLIHLPESYHSSGDRKYPVLYTLDGNTHFKHITGTVDWLSRNTGRIPQMIVVAIVNTDRRRDMTTAYNEGGADKFRQFIKEELIPHIDQQYRTHSFRILAGHSMAGFFTLDTLLKDPTLFKGYIAMSPWFLQDDDKQHLVKQSAKKLNATQYTPRFLFASIGDEPRLKPLFDHFIKVLDQFAPQQLHWQSQFYPLDNHMSVPSNTMNNALQAFFVEQRLSPDSKIAQQGVEAIKEYYLKISKETYGYTISPEPTINNLGYRALGEQQIGKAIKYFQANINEFPSSPNAYDSMADALAAKNKLIEALEMVKTAIEISQKYKLGNLAGFKRHQGNLEKLIEQSNNKS